MWPRRKILVTTVTGVTLWPVCAAQDGCYTPGGVAGIVIATIIVTLIFGGLTAAVARYLWKHRTAPSKGGGKVTLPETCLPEKQPIGPKTDYAFDNPYFKDDDGGDQGATPDAAEKGEAGFASDRGDNDNSQNSKNNSGSKLKKHKPFANIPFYSVFGQGNKKTKSMDDTFICKQQTERISVPLRGHDFTGLGFNICGNMRDGIFIKDVLHRGPASESGKIKAGDRIISVTVSFGSIVYEDALTILSYASPYDVKLEIEEGGEKNALLATSSPGKRLASASFRNGGQRLFHPLYRSQSIDDLTQIGKESFSLQSKSAGSASSYKRSQSIQAPAPKTRPQLKLSESAPDTKALDSSKRSRQSSTSSESSLSKKISTETLENSSCEELMQRKEVPDNVKSDLVKDNLLKLVNIPLVAGENDAADSNTTEPLVQENIKKQEISNVSEGTKSSGETTSVQQRNLEESVFNLQMPKAPPRKQNTPGKRKAPSPPKLQLNPTATEISAVVHQVDEAMECHLSANPTISSKLTEQSEIDRTGSTEQSEIGAKTPKNAEILVSEGLGDEHYEKTENSTSTSGGSLDSSGEIPEPPSPKRKASSLGDLTKLNENRNKNVSSTILERAVSLDLQQQQSVPESNLERQKKILKPPAFNPEDTSEEDFENVRDQEMPTKNWEIGGPWEKLPVSLVDNSDCDLVVSEVTSVLSPSKKDLDNSSITNGHHPTLDEVCSKSDDTSAACSKIKGDTSPPVPSLSASISSTRRETEYQNNTSTPARKVVEFDNFFEGSSPIEISAKDKEEERENSLEEREKHGSDNNISEKTSSFGRNTHSVSVPVSLSIPIIPPVIHHYEKLSISPSCNSQGQKDNFDSSRQDSEEKDIPSLYKPVFLTKQLKTTNAVLTMSLSPGTEPIKKFAEETQESWNSKEKDSTLTPSTSVNGDEAEVSSVGQYRTAVEFPTVSDNTVFITSKLCNASPSLNSLATDAANKYPSTEISETSIHGNDFSHAKKGTASGPSGEDLPRLNSGSNSPPPQLEPPQ